MNARRRGGVAVYAAALAITTVHPARAQDAAGADRRAITFDDFAALGAVSDPQMSADGQRVLFAVRSTDVAANKRTTVTYVIPSAGVLRFDFRTIRRSWPRHAGRRTGDWWPT